MIINTKIQNFNEFYFWKNFGQTAVGGFIIDEVGLDFNEFDFDENSVV